MVAVMVACRTQDRLTDAGGDMTGFTHRDAHTHTRSLCLERQRFFPGDLGQLIRKYVKYVFSGLCPFVSLSFVPSLSSSSFLSHLSSKLDPTFGAEQSYF